MKLIGITKNTITKEKHGVNVLHLDINEVVLVHCKISHTDYHQNSKVLYTFVSSKSLDQLLETSLTNFIFLKTFNREFSYIELWSTDQNINR